MNDFSAATLERLSPQEKRDLLQRLLVEKAAKPAGIDWDAEVQLDLTLSPQRVESDPASPGSIFLTGTTGFVGAFTLVELLARTEARIYCLARAQDDVDAERRIRENLTKYGIWDESIGARIIPLAGDLADEHFGRSVEEFAAIAANVDAVYHIAAMVNLTDRYSRLKPTNVEGTRQILRLAAEGRTKPLHYLSSYGIFDSLQGMDQTFSELDEPSDPRGLSNGYSESKLISEVLVRKARALGLPVAIYRVGWVVGHSVSGAWNTSDVIPRLVKSCVELGLACPLGTMTMTPVDFLVRSLVHLSFATASLGQNFHLSNGERYSATQLLDWAREFGYAVLRTDYETWERAMKTSTQELSLAPMLMFLELAAESNVKMSDWFAREPKIDTRRTIAHLAAQGIEAPQVDRSLMDVYLRHFIASGYLPPPRVRS